MNSTHSVQPPTPPPTLEDLKETVERIRRKFGPPPPDIYVSELLDPDEVCPMPDMIVMGTRAFEKLRNLLEEMNR